MPSEPRMTMHVQSVLRVMLDTPTDPHYGFEIAKAADIKSGTLYPLLARLEKAKWISSAWEDIDPSAEGRPARRYYRLTNEGLAKAQVELDKTIQRLMPRGQRLGLQGES